MPSSPNIHVLNDIYHLYDQYSQDLSVACCKFCADCCTANVTITRAEGLYLLHHLSDDDRLSLIESLSGCRSQARYQPTASTNGFVRQCAEQEAPSEEENLPEWGRCPLLQDDACLIYSGRPFGCRCMMSVHPCRESGQAEIDPFTMTVSTVFMQFIEHVDTGGFFGNMIDVLLKLSAENQHDTSDLVTVPNQAIPALMVPPEHRQKIVLLINDLHRVITSVNK